MGRRSSAALLAGVLLAMGCAETEPASSRSDERSGLEAKGVTVQVPLGGSVVTARGDSMRSDQALDRIVLEGNVRLDGNLPSKVEIAADRLEIHRASERGVFSGRVHADFDAPVEERPRDGGPR